MQTPCFEMSTDGTRDQPHPPSLEDTGPALSRSCGLHSGFARCADDTVTMPCSHKVQFVPAFSYLPLRTFRCGTLAWAADAASTRQASRRREGQLVRADECRRHVAHLDAAERVRCFEA